MKNDLTVGSNKIPSFIVNYCIHYLIVHLKVIFNLAIDTSRFPSLWKDSKTIHLHKSGTTASLLRLGFLVRNCRKFIDTGLLKVLYFVYIKSKLVLDQEIITLLGDILTYFAVHYTFKV